MLSMMLLEVMDKEPSIRSMWISALVLGGGGLLLCRRWPWLVLLILPVVALGTWALSAEIADPFVGPAILREAGTNYPTHAYASGALSAILPLMGYVRWLRGRRRARVVAGEAA
jgi:hypothetical protein